METADHFLRVSILNRVSASKHGTTAPAVAAMLNLDLKLTVAAIDALVANGYLEQDGVLYRVPEPKWAA